VIFETFSANYFRELRQGELPRIPLPRTLVNKGLIPPPVIYIEPWVTLSLLGVEAMLQGKEVMRMSEQAKKVKYKNMPEWAEGLYYSSGLMSEVLVYYDEEAIYFEHKGKDSGIVRFTFEQIEGLKIVEEEESTDSAG
jgi:hypothetical protein